MTDPAASAPARRVAVVMFDDVEVLDFAGPFEVFGVTRTQAGEAAFEVFTVALTGGEIVARNGLRVTPNADPSNLGRVDILVVPGGIGTRREMNNPAMLDFVRRTSADAEVTLSVCTGSLILAAAGVLEGLGATTHYVAMDELRAFDGFDVLDDVRFVDNGRIVTSTGVSAGIDAALHLVARLTDPAVAAATAHYMQYDWRPQA